MNKHKRQRNNAVAGFFVLTSTVGLLIVVFLLSGFQGLGGTQALTAYFPINLGVPGLDKGSDVTVGGIRAGKVISIAARLADDGAHKAGILVNFTVNNKYPITKDTEIGLVLPLIGSGTMLNIGKIGNGVLATSDDELQGVIAESLILKASGIEIQEVRSVISNVKNISDNLNEQIEQNSEYMVKSTKETLEKIQSIVTQFDELWPTWKARINSITENADLTIKQGPQFMEQADKTFTKINSSIDNANSGIDDVRSIITNVKPNIENITRNVDDITYEINNYTMAQIMDFLEGGKTGLDKAITLIDNVDKGLASRLPEVGKILGNMRLSSYYLKLAMIEIRSQPWRLLYTPKRNEVRESMMHDVVRTYASAVSDLDAAIESLRDLYDRHGDNLDPDDKQLQMLLQQLEKSFSQYADKETALFDQVLHVPANDK